MLNSIQYAELTARNDQYEAWRTGQPGGGQCLTVEQQAQAPCTVTNEERSALEVYKFIVNPPDHYFAYVNETTNTLTTWTGEHLGDVSFGREWTDNFGGKRVPILVRAVNRQKYHGTYFKSSGSYARLRRSKS